MSANWKTHKLQEITSKIGSGSTPRGGKEAYLENSDISLIRSQNVLDFSFSMDGLAFISCEQAHELRSVTIEKDDILLNITGDSVARVCKVPPELLPARVNQHVAIIRANKEKINSDFLKYYLLEPSFKEYMLGLASSGATRNALTKIMIENFEIRLPDLKTQHSIASVLNSLDNKIELNLQMNQTLEAITQAIFKEWFVNFNFPGFDGKLVNGLPQGWKKGKVEDLFILQRGFDLPATQRTEGLYPVVAASGISTYHHEYKVLGPGVTTGRSGVLGKVYFVNENFWPLNTSLFIKEYRNSTSLFAYHTLKSIDLLSLNGGSAVPTLNRSDVHGLDANIPDYELITRFEEVTQKLFVKIFENENQRKSLTQIRDGLLPKLMAGKIDKLIS